MAIDTRKLPRRQPSIRRPRAPEAPSPGPRENPVVVRRY